VKEDEEIGKERGIVHAELHRNGTRNIKKKKKEKKNRRREEEEEE